MLPVSTVDLFASSNAGASSSNGAKVAFVFPGQGSQKAGMLQDLAAQFAVVEQTFAKASAVVGEDLWAIVQTGDAKLDQTQYTQPILLAASTAIWHIITQQLAQQHVPQPAVVLGHSLGEYSALVAAGAIAFEDAIALVHARGQYMLQAVAAGVGAMAAVLGLSNDEVVDICQATSSSDAVVEAANFNAVGQVVIAGHKAAVELALNEVQARGARGMLLPVSVPSHCSLMAPAAQLLAERLNSVDICMPNIPVIQNVNAQVASSVDEIRQNLLAQLTQSVLWTQSMDVLAGHNVAQIVECGAGNVLCNLAKRQKTPIAALPTDTPARLEQAVAQMSALTSNL